MKRLVLVLAVLLLLGETGLAQRQSVENTAVLESHMDGMIKAYMAENDIAGATVGMVKNGKTLLLKGYGFSDVENSISVDPEKTLFRVGSISKTFVWTAVMQLASRDKLDLNEDINTYLEDFSVPATYEVPVTMRHLMTHTPGFEEYIIGLFSPDSASVRPLGEILKVEMPARVRAPGELASYSNHGTAIAAYIVEQLSGIPFETYVERHILRPLQMYDTSFRQPLPDSLRGQLSKGYSFREGEYREEGFEYVPLGPIGGASATASDMLSYMQAHLNLGTFSGATILDSAAARRMQTPAFRHAESVNPVRLGFYDMSRNGINIYGHGGDTFWFHSLMALFPEQNMGLFFSFNSEGGGGTTSDLLADFVDYYFPEEGPFADTLSLGTQYLQRFAGDYRGIRYPHERLTKLLALAGSIPVTVTDKGRLRTLFGEKAEIWVPIDSLSFRKEDSSEKLAFRENAEGEITHMFSDTIPVIAFEKTPFISSRGLHLAIFTVSALAILATVFYWPVAFLVRRNYHPGASAKPSLPLKIKLAAWTAAFLLLVFYIGMVIATSGPEAIVYGIAPSIKVLLSLPVLSALIVLGMLFYCWRVWKEGFGGVTSRISYSLLTLVLLLHMWQMYYWNVLGFQY